MKTRISLAVILFFIVVCVAGCEKEKIEARNTTRFSQYSQSCSVGKTTLNLTFFTKEDGLRLWNSEQILECNLKIGNAVVPAQIDQLELSDKPIYDMYYMGSVSINVDLIEASGEAYLQINFDSEASICEFGLGTIRVLDDKETTYDSIGQLLSGGIVATDENDNVFTYGIIVHCQIMEPITITEIGFGLSSVGLCADECVIYTPSEYQSGVRESIENTEYDKYVPTAYTKKYASPIIKSADIDLTAGEYYIYFPVVVTGDDVPAVNQASIVLAYKNQSDEEQSFVSSSWPYFTEMSKSSVALENLFLAS